MKKTLRFLSILVLVLGLLVGCSTTNTPGNDKDPEPKKGKILNFVISNLGDFGFGDLGALATKTVAEKFNLEYNVIEAGVDTSTYETTILDAIETGEYSYVITPAWYILDAILEKANTDYKDITFILFDTSPTLDLSAYDNVIGVSYKQNEGSFLAAIYSCLMTKTNKVGAIAGSDSPILNDFLTGYINGVKWYNETFGTDIEYVVTYVGQLTIQTDYETAKVLYESGVDVLYNIAGSAALGAAQAAEEMGGTDKGYYLIGVDADQWKTFQMAGTDVKGYNNLVTSMLKNIVETVSWAFDGVMEKNVELKNYRRGIVENGVALAKNENFLEKTPKNVQESLTKIENQIKAGEVTVKSYFDFKSYEEFAAYRDKQ